MLPASDPYPYLSISWCPSSRYRRLRSYFAASKQWSQFDPFIPLKDKAFKHSRTYVLRMRFSIRLLKLLLRFWRTCQNDAWARNCAQTRWGAIGGLFSSDDSNESLVSLSPRFSLYSYRNTGAMQLYPSLFCIITIEMLDLVLLRTCRF